MGTPLTKMYESVNRKQDLLRLPPEPAAAFVRRVLTDPSILKLGYALPGDLWALSARLGLAAVRAVQPAVDVRPLQAALSRASGPLQRVSESSRCFGSYLRFKPGLAMVRSMAPAVDVRPLQAAVSPGGGPQQRLRVPPLGCPLLCRNVSSVFLTIKAGLHGSGFRSGRCRQPSPHSGFCLGMSCTARMLLMNNKRYRRPARSPLVLTGAAARAVRLCGSASGRPLDKALQVCQ